MARYYQDFIGLNTFVYDANGWDTTQQTASFMGSLYDGYEAGYGTTGYIRQVKQNHLGWFDWGDVDQRTAKVSDLVFWKNQYWPFSSSSPNGPNQQPYPYADQGMSYVFNALMIYRNGPYGYPSWKQIRAGQNPLTRKQVLHNIFTYVVEPGPSVYFKRIGQNYSNTLRYGQIKVFKEPVVSSPAHPLSLIGGIKVYNERTNTYNLKTVKIQTTLGNETLFFANEEINRYYGTIEESDENYESFKDLYLDDGLESDSSPIDEFNLMTYHQTIWPKIQNAYLNKTRSRTYFVNKFWRDQRNLRTASSASSFGTVIPNQSIWPLDPLGNFAVTGGAPQILPIVPGSTAIVSNALYQLVDWPIGGGGGQLLLSRYNWNTGNRPNYFASTAYGIYNVVSSSEQGGAGILQNTYSHLCAGLWVSSSNSHLAEPPGVTPSGSMLGSMVAFGSYEPYTSLTASCFYSRLHTLNTMTSLVSPSGMDLAEVTPGDMIDSGSYFAGATAWDAPRQREAKRGLNSNPFYDSYDDFAADTRLKGKDYSIIPEFRISSHVNFYQHKGVTEDLSSIFELSGALSENTTTANSLSLGNFYTIISNSDFMKHFEMIKEDHENFTKPAVITLKCKAIKKFLPYEGFYPAQRTVQLSEQFYESHKQHIAVGNTSGGAWSGAGTASFGLQPLLEPLFAPGILFNTIKAGVACDYPVISKADGLVSGSVNMWGYRNGQCNNFAIFGSDLGSLSGSNHASMFSKRIPFEALVNPRLHMAGRQFLNQEPNPLGLAEFNFETVWSGGGDKLYSKMANNFLAEVPEFFLKDQNFTTLSSLESSNPEFGNAISGTFYTMRVKMHRSRNKPNDFFNGWNGVDATPPQDLFPRTGVRETFTMYSRPSAFGPPTLGGMIVSASNTGVAGGLAPMGRYDRYNVDGTYYYYPPLDSRNGFNFPYTPPYYHGDAWCDLIWHCTETRKYTVSEIMLQAKEWPYYTRYNGEKGMNVLRDLAGGNMGHIPGPYQSYVDSPWARLILDEDNGWTFLGPSYTSNARQASLTYYDQPMWIYRTFQGTSDQITLRKEPPPSASSPWASLTGPLEYFALSPGRINLNAMQLDSSLNIFGKGMQQRLDLDDDGRANQVEVYTEATQEAKSRWTIQTKFETPMLNFNKYTNLGENNCTTPTYASESVSRGMWHQYGEIPTDPSMGVFLEVGDIPESWFRGQLRISPTVYNKKIRSLADLVGFDKNSKRLGECASIKQISEAVVAVPFTEKDGTRHFFPIPRIDIDEITLAIVREANGSQVEPPRAGNSVVELVKKMGKYVMPPSMDFVKYNAINPFAMYIFEFKHNLTKQDLADIWQNLPPTISTEMMEAEASISHPLLAEELFGGGARRSKGGTSLRGAPGDELPSDVRWMIFKVKKRAKTDYFSKIVKNTGDSPPSGIKLANESEAKKLQRDTGIDLEITYNWPYDFFSLVELVKLEAEITFADIEDIVGKPRTIKPKRSTRSTTKGRRIKAIAKARGRKPTRQRGED